MQHLLGVHVVVVVERLHNGEVSVEADTAEVEGAHLDRRGWQGGQGGQGGARGSKEKLRGTRRNKEAQGGTQSNKQKQGGAGMNKEEQ